MGFDVVDGYAAVHSLTLRKRILRRYQFATIKTPKAVVFLAKPLTYMNRSGEVLPPLLRLSGATLSELIVVCDNMDLPVGAVRIKQRGSAPSHNGLRSVMEVLGTSEFARLYVGVGRPADSTDVVAHVLSRPAPEEQVLRDRGVKRAVEALTLLEKHDFAAVANVINRRA